MGRPLDEDIIIKILERWQKAFKENSHYVSASDLSLVIKDVRELPTIQPEPPIIKCKDCKWWRKQKDSAQGRCRLLGIYPTGAWYCADAERRTDE